MTTASLVRSCRIASLTIALAAVILVGAVGPARAADVGYAFTYQGSLIDGGSAPTGPFDFRFTLFDAASGGTQFGGTIVMDDLQVTSGIFTTDIDFGTAAFYSGARWLQIEVRAGGSTGAYTLLPRQRLNPSPFAMRLSLPFTQYSSSTGTLLSVENRGGGSGALFSTGIGTAVSHGVVGYSMSSASQAAGVQGENGSPEGQVIGVEGRATTSPDGTGIVGKAKATGGYLQATDPGSTGLFAYGEATGAHIQGTGSSSVGLSVYGGGSGARVEGTGTLSTGFYAFGNFRGIYAESRGIGAAVEARRVSGTGHLILAANTGGNQFWVDNSGVTHTKVLEIMGGSDLSEKFEVGESEATIEPGTVVSIDDDHEGRLAVSRAPYDRRVAGIISGAGGVKTGMLMGQEGSVADGAHPVALTGRVYCRATAANGPIRPGDLLTTSGVPGRAMRVDDPARAQGAILGKAMGSLEKGEGLVLVLVGLQ